MPSPLRVTIRTVRVVAGTVALLTAIACESRPSASNLDSASTSGGRGGADSVATTVSSSGWDSGAGPFVVLPTVDGGLMSGSLLRPDATELTVGDTAGVGAASADGRIELFSRSGKVGMARLSVEGAPRVDDGCTAWPVARLAADAGVTVAPWTAAFVMGRISAILLDSIEGLAPRDSARLATDLTRLASGLADDTSSTFRGLPFVVLRAWRTRGLDTAFVVATLARRVNQEDDPKEERLVMVVDAIGDNTKLWTVAWHERASGHEEELVVAEPLLAFRNVGVPDVRLLFGRDDGVALGAAVLSRGKRGWRVLWESAVAGCN
ncbi:hypothetical protein [Gemmatimonas sp.]|uniref:hypothetical protein n=1 Tax=Gemmatimonas sp. TaxID=1962908 RepID=UPI003983661F